MPLWTQIKPLLIAGFAGLALVGVAVPVFFLGFLLKYVFASKLGWLPPSGRQAVDINATHVTGFAVLDGVVTGEYDASWDAIRHLILPMNQLAPLGKATALRRCPITRSEAQCACRTSACISKDAWRSWTSIPSWCCRQVRE